MGTPRKFTPFDAPPLGPGIDPTKYIGKKPNKVIPVPNEYRRQTLAREGQILVNELRIGANCHVELDWDYNKIIKFEVYGTGADVERGVSQINRWISRAHTKSKDSSAWAKIPAYDFDDWYYDRIENIQDERKLLFKGPMPLEGHPDAPTYSVILNWPQMFSDDNLYPRDVFGNKLERLDTLRMQDKVWFVPSQDRISANWKITIAGHGQTHVELAMDHLVAHLNQVRSETSGLGHTCNVLLDFEEGINIKLQRTDDWWPNHTDPVVPRLLPSPLMNAPGTFRHSEAGLPSVYLSTVQTAIKVVLERVRGRKGSYDFAVRLGLIAIKAKHVSEDKIGQTFDKNIFLKDIDRKIELDFKRWLANDDVGYRILRRFMSRDDVFEPTRSGGYFGFLPKTLTETRPTFRGTWVFRDPNSIISVTHAAPRHAGRPVPMSPSPAARESTASPTVSSFVVEIDWSEDEEDLYEKGSPRYYKLEAEASGVKRNLDVNLLELGESRGWHFALESKIAVLERVVPPVLVGFAQRVKMKPNYDPRSTENFAQWEATPTIKQHLLTGRLDSVYSFGVKGTDYKAELTAMWYPGNQPVNFHSGASCHPPSQNKPVWGLFVRHLDWATHLAELECLPIGSRANWEDTISTFFPEDEELSLGALRLEDKGATNLPVSGLDILTRKLLKLSEVVSSVTNEGGVAV
ncbi:hypothetical protein DE146DRAFT_29117 [Phaeosphaeria sp. MPI-PUGE-AT-0046c]|nr:hypothetical protein DE146DRAFT_29117 [Phaeosphaeria sp. MPI-PUGE-AT-0046c]